MSFRIDTGQGCRIFSNILILLVIIGTVLVSGCHRHYRPVAHAKTPTTIVKRQLNSDGSYYVRSGDTLYAIAFSYGLDPMDVAQQNGITSPYTIYPGQKLMLQVPGAGPGERQASSGVQITAVKTPGQVTTKTIESPTSSTVTKPAPAKPTTNEAAENTTKASTQVAPPVSNTADPKSWEWPTSGRVVRGFVAGDPARNGLDIAGKEGQEIVASSSGQVVYSGNGLIGYGELIIIKHSEKMLSAYAHNRVRLVKEGDQVWAGQKIAEMGRNSSDEQILHFEIRTLGKPVNPLTYLPKR